MKRLIVAITGATGAIYGVRILEELRRHPEWETHLIVSNAGALNLRYELDKSAKQVSELAHVMHDIRNIGASIASGSFPVEGMVVAPCSMKTLSSIAHAYADNAIARAADVTLKERRRLVLVVRETPLTIAHLRNMLAVSEMGGIIYPPVPAFYAGFNSIAEMVDYTVARILDLFSIPFTGALNRWQGIGREAGGAHE